MHSFLLDLAVGTIINLIIVWIASYSNSGSIGDQIILTVIGFLTALSFGHYAIWIIRGF